MDMERLQRVLSRVQGDEKTPAMPDKGQGEREELRALWIDAAEEQRRVESLMRRSAVCRQKLAPCAESLRRREAEMQCEYFLRFGDSPVRSAERRARQKGVLSALRELYAGMEATRKHLEAAAARYAAERFGETCAAFAEEERRHAAAVRALLEQTAHG